jgi:hypothetical protein
MATFNPMTAAEPEEVLAALAASVDLTLTSDQEEAALAIIRSLPTGATLRDFVKACDQDAARKLRISRETLEAVKPLLAVFGVRGKRGDRVQSERARPLIE